MAAWQREFQLAAPEYRRGLRLTRPTAGEIRSLRSERAASDATVVRVERDDRTRFPRARVIVTMRERNAVGAHELMAETQNEVLLAQLRDSWRVTGWTVVMDGSAAP
jgi:hypothetical protein